MTKTITKKLYGKRNPIKQGQHYMNHLMAMTAEGLHSKSDIAAELAHRDIVIEDLFDIYWQLLNAIEMHTDPKEDILNKLLVESAYKVVNRHGLSKHTPRWNNKLTNNE